MTTKMFNFLKEDTRLFKFQNCIYKIKVLYDDEKNLADIVPNFSQKDASEDLENVVRAVLYVLERKGDFKMIVTERFIVTVKIKPWKASQKIGFKKNGHVIKSCPYMIVLNVRLKFNQSSTKKSYELSPTPLSNEALQSLKKDALNSDVRVMLNKLKLPLKQNQNKNDNNSTTSQKHDKRKSNQHCQPSKNVEVGNSSPISEESEEESVTSSVEMSDCPAEGPVIHRGRRKRKLPRSQSSSPTPVTTVQTRRGKMKKGVSNEKDSIVVQVSVHQSMDNHTSVSSSSKSHQSGIDQTMERPVKQKTALDDNIRKNRNLVQTLDENEGPHLRSFKKRSSKNKSSNSEKMLYKSSNCDLNMDSVKRKQPDINVTQLHHHQKDRHFIEKEELAEDMKLQQLAKSSPSEKKDPKRSSSGIWNIVETIITPVKNVFSRK
ncbi:uncharacterized protein LOC126826998 [Patella vulgata]|uniref:uncharacterized protein LOC126826998 n=1 Tax=Patella vulgata TaxID=6465 RepID=UPI0024A8A870|nr:uncharacterized protein LOC126826998 [Patella vulgata]